MASPPNSRAGRRSVRFPQVFPSVTVDQGVRDLLQQHTDASPRREREHDHFTETTFRRAGSCCDCQRVRQEFRGCLGDMNGTGDPCLGAISTPSNLSAGEPGESPGALSSARFQRQIEDDDSLPGDFGRHHFLDDVSRQQWNLQHGVSGPVRYCWFEGAENPSVGPVSTSSSDLSAYLTTVDRLHDDYIRSFRRESYELNDENVSPQEKEHTERLRDAYNWFVSRSCPREKQKFDDEHAEAAPESRKSSDSDAN